MHTNTIYIGNDGESEREEGDIVMYIEACIYNVHRANIITVYYDG